MKQAEESLDEARFLLQGDKSLRSVVNRAYYAMFYSVLALLVFEEFSSSKHSGIIAFFNRRFIKEKVFQEEMGRWLGSAFDMRQRGDYREYVQLSHERVRGLVENAGTFVEVIRRYLEEEVFV